MTAAHPLDVLLAQARDADRADRITLRDPIAAHGESAIEPMTDWLGDPELAAFAIRVLERIGREPAERAAAVAVLRAVDRTELPPHLIGDLDRSLAALGASAVKAGRARLPSSPDALRPPGLPGTPGQGYWVMRTSPWERPYIWAEAQAGRLRQGWGTQEDQNLETIAAALRRGDQLSPSQQEARRALRMLTSWEHGMRVGDVVVAPNLPDYGRLAIVRVTGSYAWAPAPPRRFGERFGHVLPVEMLLTDIDRHGPNVSEGLRAVLRVQTRLYNISGYGGDIERLLGGQASADRWGELWTEAEYAYLFGRFPPDGPRPTDAEVELVAVELGRTPDAISWQWADGAAYCGGGSASTASEPLKVWLDKRGMAREAAAASMARSVGEATKGLARKPKHPRPSDPTTRDSELERRADELLTAIGYESSRIGDRPLTMHWPTVGSAFDHGVLVVGQAVYGWMNSWTAAQARNANERARVIAAAKTPFPHLQDPMGWIDGHHARISPFWTVAHRVTDALAPGDAPWFSRLAWTNLCPVAPNDVKGNPAGALLDVQTVPAAAFLDAAIEQIQPRLVLVVGGPYVWPFVDPLGLRVLGQADKPLYRAGRRNGSIWIVGMHPAGASRRGWGPAAYAGLILSRFDTVSGLALDSKR